MDLPLDGSLREKVLFCLLLGMLREVPSPDQIYLGLNSGKRMALRGGITPEVVRDVLARVIDWRKSNPHFMQGMF